MSQGETPTIEYVVIVDSTARDEVVGPVETALAAEGSEETERLVEAEMEPPATRTRMEALLATKEKIRREAVALLGNVRKASSRVANTLHEFAEKVEYGVGQVVHSDISFGMLVFTEIVDLTRKVCDTKDRIACSKFRFADEHAAAVTGSHPDSAGARDAGVRRIRRFIKYQLGRETYDISTSKQGRDDGVERRLRSPWSQQDLSQPFHHGKWNKRDVVTIIDTDNHMSAHKLMQIIHGRLAFIWTLDPLDLAGEDGNGTYWWSGVDTVEERVEGGAHYVNRVHFYDKDQVVMEYKHFGCWRYTVYNVITVPQPNTARKLVIMVPSSHHVLSLRRTVEWAKMLGNFEFKVNLFGDGPPKVHEHYIEGVSFLIMYAGTSNKSMVSIKRTAAQSWDSSVQIPWDVYEALVFYRKRNRELWNEACLARWLLMMKLENIDPIHMSVLCQFCEIDALSPQSVNYVTLAGGKAKHATDVGKKPASLGAVPLTETVGVVLSKTSTDMEVSEAERITPNVNTITPDDMYDKYREEFVKLVVPHNIMGRGFLVAERQVIEEQDSKLQKRRNRVEAMFALPMPEKNKHARSSLKISVDKNPGPPRVINIIPTRATWGTGQVARMMSTALKNTPWYAVGLRPEQLAELLQRVAIRSMREQLCIVETDFSKCDETLSVWLRDIANMCAMRYAMKPYREAVRIILEEDAKMLVKMGAKFVNPLKNKSGSGLTTYINTVVCAFMVYAGHRKMGIEPAEAFKLIGAGYGDDGTHPGPCIKEKTQDEAEEVKANYKTAYVGVATDLGLKLKCVFHEPGTETFFCGRWYPDLVASMTSYGDVYAVLSRIPVIKNKHPKMLENRIRGYYQSEKNTPLVGEYLRAIARLNNIDLSAKIKMDKDVDREMFYKYEAGSYPYAGDSDRAIMMRLISQQLKMDGVQIERIEAQLRSAKSDADMKAIDKLPALGVIPPACVMLV